MKTQRQTVLVAIPFITLLLVQHLAHANSTLSRNFPRVLAVSDESTNLYRLTLSLMQDTSSWSPNTPYITLNLANYTQHTLFFSWAPNVDPNFVVFQVQYKAPKTNPNSDNGWKQLKPNSRFAPVSGVLKRGTTVIEVNAKQGVPVLPGQSGRLSFPPDFPMSKDGFYRLSAVLTVPQASEYNGTISPSTRLRGFKLVARSSPIIIRRTATGFVEVPSTADKQAPAK